MWSLNNVAIFPHIRGLYSVWLVQLICRHAPLLFLSLSVPVLNMLLNELLCISKVPPGTKHVDMDLAALPPTTAMAVLLYNRWWAASFTCTLTLGSCFWGSPFAPGISSIFGTVSLEGDTFYLWLCRWKACCWNCGGNLTFVKLFYLLWLNWPFFVFLSFL